MLKSGGSLSGACRGKRGTKGGIIVSPEGVPPGRGILTNKRTGAERRRHPRHLVQPVFGGKRIGLSLPGKGHRASLRGKILNISAGGLCLLSEQVVDQNQVLRCQIQLRELPVAIPTLLQVRWIHRPPGSHTYWLGLRFLL
jgi:hypothetical protein